MCLNFYHKWRPQTWKIAYVKEEGNFECCHFGQNESAVLRLWRITDQAGPSPGFSSRGAKNQKEGPKTRRGATFLKYSIGCMQQPVGQTQNGRAPISNVGAGTTGPPAGDGPEIRCVWCKLFFFWHPWFVWKFLEARLRLAMSLQGLHWLQKLGSVKRHLEPKRSSR